MRRINAVIFMIVVFVVLLVSNCKIRSVTTTWDYRTPTMTLTQTPYISYTVTLSFTNTPVSSPTCTITFPSNTPTFTQTVTVSGTYTALNTFTSSVTDSPVFSATETPTSTLTATVAPTSTMTATPCMLFGNTGMSWNCLLTLVKYTDPVGPATAFEMFTAVAGTTVTKIYFYCAGSLGAGYRAGLYSDAAGCPGTLLTSNTSFIYPPDTGVWVAVEMPDYIIPTTGSYWLAITSDGTNYAGIGQHQQSGISNISYLKYTEELPPVGVPSCSFDYNYPNNALMIYASCE